ncbi:hypothetical protein CPC16_000738 [Podila verticillata]|uniref:Galactose oxidase n=1 Tax=Podila verticillata NRRL 6337 TaxID=1069443 RepID=A0A086TIY5_9FUNG|nr:hypothetical protein CPC16_000738 [Podila verticillata]KFH61912.1 hypothetical protein MVEG_12246 [Podila verticillata NRRL 6337]
MNTRKRNILTLFACLSLTNAQSPASVRRMGYTQVDDKLFIQGGFDTSSSSQFFFLDLSTSWPDLSPAWTKLRDGQSTAHLALTTVSSAYGGGSKGSIIATGGMEAPTFFSAYDIAGNSWSNLTSVTKIPYTELEGHAAVTDPNTGLVYIIGGYMNGTNIYNTLAVYNAGTKSMVSQQTATLATSLIDVSAVWSTKRSTILTFGGSRANPSSPSAVTPATVNEYDPNTKSWSVMATSGDIPPPRLDQCMAASEDGSKIVVFGGTDGTNYFKDIYILDVGKGKWKQGTDALTSRTRFACGIHSGQLIAWGGSSASNRNTMLSNTPIIYNLNNDKWVNKYDSSMTLSSGGSTGAIIGGIVAVLALGAIAGFIFYKKRKARMEEEAYHADAMAAAAIGGNDADDNIKVSLGDSPRFQSNNPYHGHGHNDYPLSKMEINDSHAIEAARDRYRKENESSGYHGGNIEMMTSPVPSHYYPQQIQSPAATYQGTPYLSNISTNSPYTTASNNPFEDGQYNPNSSTGSASPGANPFSNVHATAPSPSMGGSDYHPPSSTTTTTTPYMQSQSHDPFAESSASPALPPLQQAQAQVYTNYSAYAAAQSMSPSPGARAPQTIPETGNEPLGYVPPPPQ